MPRGLFTQSAIVLTDRALTLEVVERALASFAPTRREATKQASWLSAGTELVVRMKPEQNGMLLVDVIDRRWPDAMGDPKEDVDLFGAWSMGGFGPLVFPGGLARAGNHAIAFPDAAKAIDRHASFIRIRTTYVLGQGQDAKAIPDAWDGLFETLFVVKVARALLELEGTLAFFDPNAEILLPADEIDASLAQAKELAIAPVDLFAHVRLFGIGDAEGWTLMDTVGLERFFLPDVEIAIDESVDPDDAASFLRGVALHLLESGDVLPAATRVEGLGSHFVVHRKERGLVDPPRAVVRLVPEGVEVPVGLL